MQNKEFSASPRFLNFLLKALLLPCPEHFRLSRGKVRLHRKIRARQVQCVFVILTHGERGDANIRQPGRQCSGYAIRSTSDAEFASGVVSALSLVEDWFVRSLLLACLCLSVAIISSGCTKPRDATITRGACSLVSKEEVESVQQTPVKDATSSERSDGTFRTSQCVYTAAELSKSVNLSLIQADPNEPSKRSPKDFWKEKFDPYEDEEPKTNRGDQKEEGAPPKKITGLGDEAYWVSNRFGGLLYVLKGDALISIGLGGTDDEQTKLEKSKALAQKALQRL